MIHEKSDLTSGLLDCQLQIKEHMKSTKELILEHLNGKDWLQLGKLAEIPVLLGLLNIENPPSEWVTDIEYDVIEAIQMFNLSL